MCFACNRTTLAINASLCVSHPPSSLYANSITVGSQCLVMKRERGVFGKNTISEPCVMIVARAGVGAQRDVARGAELLVVPARVGHARRVRQALSASLVEKVAEFSPNSAAVLPARYRARSLGRPRPPTPTCQGPRMEFSRKTFLCARSKLGHDIVRTLHVFISPSTKILLQCSKKPCIRMEEGRSRAD